MIVAKNLTKTFIGDPLFQNIDFTVGGNLKIGLVGRNGCGKTTLLKIIMGLEEVTSGSLSFQEDKVGYIPQEFSFPDEYVGIYLENLIEEKYEMYKIEMLLKQLKFENYDPYQKIKTLSAGQQMKIKMIEVLLQDPITLLIDEPTNHLDIDGILWFEKYVKHLHKTVLMISHDREFLNNTVDEIWELEDKRLTKFVGNYDNYREQKLKLIDKWDQEYILFLKKKVQLEKLIENMHKIKDGKKRGRAISSAKKRYEREIVDNQKDKYHVDKMHQVDFDTNIHNGKLVFRLKNVGKKYGEKEIFDNVNLEIRGKEKVWLFGPNGAGKSTIVKFLVGRDSPSEGDIVVGPNLKIGYFAQQSEHSKIDTSLIDFYIDATGCEYGKAIGQLQKYLFKKEDLKKPIRHLSPGQRARYSFAIFAYNDYDLLILDEPTNHLDIETTEVIEESLINYKGTIILVSHDRFFVERLGVDRVLSLRDGTLNEAI